MCALWVGVFFFKQKTACEMRISDCSSDVCSSDLHALDMRLEHIGHRRECGFGHREQRVGVGGGSGPCAGQVGGQAALVAHRTHPYGERTALTSGRNKMVRKLDETQRNALLARFPEWTHEPSRDAITRRFQFADFAQARSEEH